MWTNELTRRDLFAFSKHGLASVALTNLLLRDGTLRAAPVPSRGTAGLSHRPGAAKRAIHIVLCGGLSQVDSFDYKPALARHHGKPLGSDVKPDVFFGKVGLLRKNDWGFRPRGQSGLWISELFPHLAQVADKLTVIRSMFAETSNHTPATFQQNTGFRLNGFPVLGSWLSYGLGVETDRLPGYIVIPDSRGVPAGGSINWTNGFLPARHQGVTIRAHGTPIDDLFPAPAISANSERASRALLEVLNRKHLALRASEDVLQARIRSYELAAKMQLAVPQAVELGNESAHTWALYGLDDKETAEFGSSCLMARRLLEEGVRFIQIFSGGAFGQPRINWDGHEDMVRNHSREARRIDKPIAGLLRDLDRRGMLGETLVLFTSEFGRTPFAQSNKGTLSNGRDHNQDGFTVWMAGAGLQPGIAYGSTDEVGFKAVEDRVSWYDFHATVLHLLGIDHERLTFYHNGIERRLTNVHGKVIRALLG